MIRTVIMVAVWALALLLLGPPLLVYSLLTSSVEVMYRIGTYVGISGVKLIGVKVDVRGLEHLEAGRNYIFMSNHVSNLDPPVLIPSIPGRCSVLVKKEVFRIPILGLAMRMAALVPVDRRHRERACCGRGHAPPYPYGDFRGGYPLLGWAAAALQKGAVSFGDGGRSTGCSGHDS